VVHAAHSHEREGVLRRAPTDDPLSVTFAALADPTRRAVVELLRRGPRRAGELAAGLRSTPAGLSRHLRVLRESGLVGEASLDADARVRVYRLEPTPFEAVRTWVEDIEAFWAVQLASFKAHAERTRGRRARKRSAKA
jgi:DNA-binding transcriptional ArsR family regulator